MPQSSPLSRSRPIFERDLAHFGLSEKESKVYLASLEIGPATVLEIAKQAEVNRATSYLMIESLIRRGLMSSIERAQKRVFMAESPERLKQLLRREENRIRDAHETLERILPELAVLLEASPDRPRVRFYEGFDGLESMRAEFFKTEKKDELLVIAAADDYHAILGMARRLPHAKRIERTRGFERCIFTSARSIAELRKTLTLVENIERYRIPESQYPLAGEISVYGPKIALLSYREEVMGVLIESPFLAKTATALFNLAWETAKKFEKVE